MTSFELVPTSKVADRLGVTRQGVLDMVARGAIKPTTKLAVVNGTYLFDPAEVERVVALRAKKTEAPK